MIPYYYGKKRTYNAELMKYGKWKDLSTTKDTKINLRQGGEIRFISQIVHESSRSKISKEIKDAGRYLKQYHICGSHVEPRIHGMFSDETDTGYKYHGVRVASNSIFKMPLLNDLKQKLEKSFGYKFNVGAHAVIYRDGNDSIGWHSDNTQGETVICAVVLSGCDCRPVKIRRSRKSPSSKKLEQGDEEITLFVREGDAYVMDGMFS